MRRLSQILLRALIATAGVLLILQSITWGDRVVVPAGTLLPDGRELHEEREFPILSARPDGQLTLLIEGKNGSETALVLDSSVVRSDRTDLRVNPGLRTTLQNARLDLMVAGLLLVALVFPFQALRWWLLMRARGFRTSPYAVFRLTMVGSFFNYLMPGIHGGDLARIFYVAKDRHRRADAVVSVVVDRVAGLLGLLVLGGVAGLFVFAHPVARGVTVFLWAAGLTAALFVLLFLSEHVRKVLGVTAFLKKLPFKERLRGAAGALLAYRRHRRALLCAVVLSLGIHGAVVVATALLGYALGIDAPVGLLLTVLPVLFLSGMLPVTYHGLGLMEGLGIALLLDPPLVTANHIVGMLLMMRVCSLLYSLLGAYFLVEGRVGLYPKRAASSGYWAHEEVRAACGYCRPHGVRHSVARSHLWLVVGSGPPFSEACSRPFRSAMRSTPCVTARWGTGLFLSASLPRRPPRGSIRNQRDLVVPLGLRTIPIRNLRGLGYG